MVRVGIEKLVDRDMDPIRGDRVGLITNPSGVDSNLVPTIDALHRHDDVELVRLFSPEHGIRGRKQTGVTIEDDIDEKTGLPVKSPYENNRGITEEMVEDLDVVVYDMQDIGCRFYTLVYTLANAMEDLNDADVRFVVLDRPNPIAPLGVHGNRVPDEFASAIGDRRLPIIHGMTVGELARYFDREFGLGAPLEIVELEGWDRSVWYDELELPWVPPSPNMPTLDTATIYPGTCLFEGTTFSEGRGTTKPFELVGAPWVNANEWATVLNELDMDGVAFRPAYFTPMFSKHERRDIEGVQVHVMDRERLVPVEVGMKMIITAFQLYPEADWIRSDGEFFIDRLAGGHYLRAAIEESDPSLSAHDVYESFEREWDGLEQFRDLYEEYSLY